MTDEVFSRIVGRIYESGADIKEWSESVSQVNSFLATDFAFLATLDRSDHRFCWSQFFGRDDSRFEVGIQEYSQHQYKLDWTIDFTTRHPNARLFDSTSISDRAKYLQNPYVKWSQDRLGSSFWSTAYSPDIHGLTLGISVHQSSEKGCLCLNKKKSLLMIFDHMKRSLHINARHPTLSDRRALIVIDMYGRIRQLSALAETIFELNDGIYRRGERMTTSRHADQIKLDSLIQSNLRIVTQETVGGWLRIPRPSGKRDFLVRVDPLPYPTASFRIFGPAVTVEIFDPTLATTQEKSHLAWRNMFRLTPAETKLAKAFVAAPGSLKACAESLGITYATARTQMVSLQAKAQVRTQAELVAVLVRMSTG